MAIKREDGMKVPSRSHDRADDLLGAVVPLRARDYVGAPTPEADLSNVIPFAPRGRKAADKTTKAPAIECAVADRPAPNTFSKVRQRQIALLIGGSLLLHGAIFAAFNREPEPHASIGVISISAEIVLGTQTDAGTEKTPSESVRVDGRVVPQIDAPVADNPEKARKEAVEAAVPITQEALPTEPTPEPREAELVATPKPVEKPAVTTTAAPEETKPESKIKKIAKKIREVALRPKDDGDQKRDRAAISSPVSPGSSGVGRGRSDLDTNYGGIVRAHLARYKQMPSSAGSGAHGTATVLFSLSGSGSVSSVRLVRGSGVAAFDQEATAMVRRASPFPAPPSGRAQTFTVPLNFQVR